MLVYDPQIVVIYDNINFKNIKRDKLFSYISVMRFLMTVVIVYCFELPLLGLCWLIYNLIIPLNVEDIYRSPGFGDKLLL